MSKFTDFFKGAFNKVTKAIAAPFNMVKDTVKTVVEAPLKIFNKGADTLSGMSKNMTGMVSGISKDIGGVANGLTGAVGGIAKGGFDSYLPPKSVMLNVTNPSSPSPSSPSSSSSASNSLWRVDELKLTNGGKLPPLLLPVTVEHVIDEASPLRGLSLDDLLGSGAEVVVQVCGSSDRGEFVVTRSYLAGELHWGCAFAPCVKRAAVVSSAAAGSGSSRSASASRLGGVRQRRRGGAAANQVPLLPPSQHVVDLSRFHEVVPLPGVGPTGIGGPPRPPAVVAAEVLGVAGGRGGGGDVL